MYVHVSADALGCQKRALDPLELEIYRWLWLWSVPSGN